MQGLYVLERLVHLVPGNTDLIGNRAHRTVSRQHDKSIRQQRNPFSLRNTPRNEIQRKAATKGMQSSVQTHQQQINKQQNNSSEQSTSPSLFGGKLWRQQRQILPRTVPSSLSGKAVFEHCAVATSTERTVVVGYTNNDYLVIAVRDFGCAPIVRRVAWFSRKEKCINALCVSTLGQFCIAVTQSGEIYSIPILASINYNKRFASSTSSTRPFRGPQQNKESHRALSLSPASSFQKMPQHSLNSPQSLGDIDDEKYSATIDITSELPFCKSHDLQSLGGYRTLFRHACQCTWWVPHTGQPALVVGTSNGQLHFVDLREKKLCCSITVRSGHSVHRIIIQQHSRSIHEAVVHVGGRSYSYIIQWQRMSDDKAGVQTAEQNLISIMDTGNFCDKAVILPMQTSFPPCPVQTRRAYPFICLFTGTTAYMFAGRDHIKPFSTFRVIPHTVVLAPTDNITFVASHPRHAHPKLSILSNLLSTSLSQDSVSFEIDPPPFPWLSCS